MRDKSIRLALTTALAVTLTLGAVSCKSDTRQIGLDEPVGGGLFVDYAKGYYSIDELVVDTDLIALGTIDRTIEVSSDDATYGRLYSTKSALKLQRVLKGEAAREVIVVQTGAIGQAEDVASPVFRQGERTFLFLKKSEIGTYYLPGPTGRYRIVDDKAYSMGYVVKNRGHYDAPPGLDFNGVGLDAFIKNVTETINATK